MLYSNVLQIKFIWMNEKISVELMQVGLVSAHLSCVTYGAGENKYWAVGNFSQWILLLILCISQAQIHIQIMSGILLFFRCIFLSKIHFPKTYSFQGLHIPLPISFQPPTHLNEFQPQSIFLCLAEPSRISDENRASNPILASGYTLVYPFFKSKSFCMCRWNVYILCIVDISLKPRLR